jgi:hypothetical protein
MGRRRWRTCHRLGTTGKGQVYGKEAIIGQGPEAGAVVKQEAGAEARGHEVR